MKKFLTLLAIAISIYSFGQKTACKSINLQSGSHCQNNNFLAGTTAWFSFKADSQKINISVKNFLSISRSYIRKISLYEGACNNLSLLNSSELSVADTSLVLNNTLVPGQTYYISLTKAGNKIAQYTLCIQNASSTPAPPFNRFKYYKDICGLDYVQVSARLNQRKTPQTGTGQKLPVTLTLTSLPSNAVVLNAYLYYTSVENTGPCSFCRSGVCTDCSYDGAFPFQNQSTGQTFSGVSTIIGSHIGFTWSATCWNGWDGTFAHRADVTSLVNGNGNYNFNITGFSAQAAAVDLDGVTLLVIYKTCEPNSKKASLVIDDGLTILGGNSMFNHSITPFTSYSVNTGIKAFILIGDLENNTTDYSINGSTGKTIAANFWNFVEDVTLPLAPNANLASYKLTSTLTDCSAISVFGIYFRDENSFCNPLLVTAMANPSTICPGQSSTLTAAGAVSYIWTPGNISGNPITVSPAVTTTYRVTGTDAGGCIASATVTVTVNNPNCCIAANKIISGSNSVTEFGAGATITGQVIDISGTFTVNSNLTFNNCRVRMAAGSQINILSPNTLTITASSNLFVCTQMWNGIFIDAGANLVLNQNSSVEDALSAIVSKNGAAFLVDNARLNKNLKHIVVKPFNGIHPGAVRNGSRLTCQNSSTSPGNLLKAPHSTKRTNIGVEITNVQAISIVSPGLRNIFSNMDFGIFADNSLLPNTTLTVERNSFQKITGSLCIGPPSSCAEIINPGIAIYTIGDLSNSISIGGSLFSRNVFLTCDRAIEVHDYKNIGINYNLFSNSTITPASQQTNRIGTHAVMVRNKAFSSGYTLSLQNNSITNWTEGIKFIFNDESTLNSATSTVNINNNSIRSSILNAANNSITVQSIIPSVVGVSNSNSFWHISNNTIAEATTGISVVNVFGDALSSFGNLVFDITENTIALQTGTPRYGIRNQGCLGILINRNTVTSPSFINPNVNGVSMELSPGFVTNNAVNTCGTGIRCMGISSITNSILSCNIMNNCMQGVFLNSTYIGDQLSGQKPQDNQWFNDPAGSLRIFSDNMGLTPNWYYRAGANYSPFPMSTPPDAVIHSLVINPDPSACTPPSPPCPPPCIQGQLAGTLQTDFEQTAFPQENRFFSQDVVFKKLKNNPALMQQNTANDAILQQFYDSVKTTAIAKLADIDELLINRNLTQAQNLNNNLNPACTIEKNHKTFNSIYLSTLSPGYFQLSSQQITALTEIAEQCPITGGRAVYQARVLLNLISGNVVDYDDNCPANPSPRIKSKIQITDAGKLFKLYPNPSNGVIQLDYELGKDETGYFIIYDISGKKQAEYSLKPGKNNTSVSGAALKNGIYFYQITVNGHTVINDKLAIIK